TLHILSQVVIVQSVRKRQESPRSRLSPQFPAPRMLANLPLRAPVSQPGKFSPPPQLDSPWPGSLAAPSPSPLSTSPEREGLPPAACESPGAWGSPATPWHRQTPPYYRAGSLPAPAHRSPEISAYRPPPAHGGRYPVAGGLR